MDILQGHSIKLSNNEFELSKRMISDLVHYARTGTMPYEPYSINNLEPHVKIKKGVGQNSFKFVVTPKDD